MTHRKIGSVPFWLSRCRYILYAVRILERTTSYYSSKAVKWGKKVHAKFVAKYQFSAHWKLTFLLTQGESHFLAITVKNLFLAWSIYSTINWFTQERSYFRVISVKNHSACLILWRNMNKFTLKRNFFLAANAIKPLGGYMDRWTNQVGG